MKRSGGTFAAVALGGFVALLSAVGPARGQAARDGDSGNRAAPPPSNPSPPPAPAITPMPKVQQTPLPPMGGRAPMPPVGGRTPLPGDRTGNAQPDHARTTSPDSSHRDAAGDRTRSSVDHARDLANEARRRHGLDDGRYYRGWTPGYYYYNNWIYNGYPGYGAGYPGTYDDGYRDRGYDAPPPSDDSAPQPAGDHTGPAGAAPGALLPPEDLMGDDDNTPAALRQALEASPQYRDATAQLLRAWADYARAAEQVLLHLRSNPAYQRALSKLRDAEANVARVRDMGGNVPAVNLVSAAQDAMLARKTVRSQEQKAIDADPLARRAKQEVDRAVERRNKIRDDLASKQAPDAEK